MLIPEISVPAIFVQFYVVRHISLPVIAHHVTGEPVNRGCRVPAAFSSSELVFVAQAQAWFRLSHLNPGNIHRRSKLFCSLMLGQLAFCLTELDSKHWLSFGRITLSCEPTTLSSAATSCRMHLDSQPLLNCRVTLPPQRG